ncbi:MAG TPA: sigma-70 family RNA polymerase sigma factor [Gemmatimonadaceae bacterium]|nr:sigma-70 family RNA polymerase sigma factor [Gemmatimonadaceae bacterium]
MRNPLGSSRRPATPEPAPPQEYPRPVLITDSGLEEQGILAAAARGDSAAFGLLVERYLPRAMALAGRILHHREDAEDLVQDAFLSALRHIENFDVARPFWPWLSRIIVNRGLDLAAARSIRSAESLGDDIPDSGDSPVVAAERSEFLDQVRAAMQTLSPRQRLIVELSELEGFSIAEIAASLDSAAATVRWHLHMARKELRKSLAHVRGAIA